MCVLTASHCDNTRKRSPLTALPLSFIIFVIDADSYFTERFYFPAFGTK